MDASLLNRSTTSCRFEDVQLPSRRTNLRAHPHKLSVARSFGLARNTRVGGFGREAPPTIVVAPSAPSGRSRGPR